MNNRLSGIIIKIPKRPPITETIITLGKSMSKPISISAGIVTPTPKAIDSPALPVVCNMLFSKMVVRFTKPVAPKILNRVIANTATGILAETVRPTFSTKYSELAPKTNPRIAPTTTARRVNSAMPALGSLAAVAICCVDMAPTPKNLLTVENLMINQMGHTGRSVNSNPGSPATTSPTKKAGTPIRSTCFTMLSAK